MLFQPITTRNMTAWLVNGTTVGDIRGFTKLSKQLQSIKFTLTFNTNLIIIIKQKVPWRSNSLSCLLLCRLQYSIIINYHNNLYNILTFPSYSYFRVLARIKSTKIYCWKYLSLMLNIDQIRVVKNRVLSDYQSESVINLSIVTCTLQTVNNVNIQPYNTYIFALSFFVC